MLNLPILLIFKDSSTVLQDIPEDRVPDKEHRPAPKWNSNHLVVMFIKTTTEWTVLENAVD